MNRRFRDSNKECTSALHSPGGANPSALHPVAVVDEMLLICYNTNLDEYGDVDCPTKTTQALNGPHAAEWKAAYVKDLEAKIKNGTFTLVPRPVGKKVLPTKVHHAVKRDPATNVVTELRARWVRCGYAQGAGDFKETYTATPTATSIRLFLVQVLSLGLFLFQGDVTKAFTLNPIDVETYCEQMPGMEQPGPDGTSKENTVCLLHKCLEGLKQAGNVWQTTHTKAMLMFTLYDTKFKQSPTEPTLFTLHCSKGVIILLVWIDEILIGCSSSSLYEEFRSLYSERFPSTHSSVVKRYAGVSISYEKGVKMVIHQKPHIDMAFEKFVEDKANARKSAAVNRPAISDRTSPRHYSKLSMATSDDERAAMKSKPYLAALATIMYVAHFTLSHLCYFTSHLGQFMHDPSLADWEAVLEIIIFAYFNAETDIIIYSPKFSIPRHVPEKCQSDFLNSSGLHAYCDASWMLRSPAGYIMMMMGGPVDWGSKLIRVICHSSSEAEIAAGCMLGKRSVFVRLLLSDFGSPPLGKFIFFIDNTAAMDLSKKLGVGTRTAHFLR